MGEILQFPFLRMKKIEAAYDEEDFYFTRKVKPWNRAAEKREWMKEAMEEL